MTQSLLLLGKHIILASLIGTFIGLFATCFLRSLYTVITVVSNIPWAWIAGPLALSISAWISLRVASETYGQGLEHVVRAIHREGGTISARVIPTKFIATLLTIGAGGSAGTVGPCVQIGGGLASLIADIFRLHPEDRRKVVMYGISAGFAAVLGAPFAGAVFAVEVLWIGALSYEALLPSIIAAIVGSRVALASGIPNWTHTLSVEGQATGLSWLIVAGAGVIFGLCAILFIEAMNLAKWMSLRTSLRLPIQGALAGVVLIAAHIFTPHALGLGVAHIPAALAGQPVAWYAFLIKILLTALTLSFGGSGGIILPICFVGTMIGSVVGSWFQTNAGMVAALGFVGLLAGAANTPLAAIVLATELFGYAITPYAMLACAISYVVAGHRSAIPTQILRTPKHPFFRGRIEREIADTELLLQPARWLGSQQRDATGDDAATPPAIDQGRERKA